MIYQEKEFSINSAIAKGRDLPDWYLDEPPTYPGDEFYLTAFYDLDSCRQTGFSIGQIPWNFIVDYAHHKGIEQSFIDTFVFIIRQMDIDYIQYVEKKMKRNQQTSKKVGN